MAYTNKKQLLSITAVFLLIALSVMPAMDVSASPWEILAGETEIIEDGAVHSYSEDIVVYGTLIVRNGSTLSLTQTGNYQYMIDVREGGQLIVENSTIDSSYYFRLYCQYESSLTLVNSTIDNAYYVYIYYSSSIDAVNTTLERYLYVYYNSRADLTGLEFSQDGRVYVYYFSEAVLTDSNFYRVQVDSKSKAVIEDSEIYYIYTYYDSEVSITGSETYCVDVEYGGYGSIEHSTIVDDGYLEAEYGSTLIIDYVVAEVGTSFDVECYYSYNEIYISNSAGIGDFVIENGYCLADNVTMIPTGELSVAGSSTLIMSDSTVGDDSYIRVNSTVWLTNVVSENGLYLDVYRGSRVYVENLTYLDDVYLYAGSIVKIMDSTFNGSSNYMELQSDSMAWLTNVVSENGLEVELYRGSEVYIKDFTNLDDVDLYGSSTIEVMDSTFNVTGGSYAYFSSNSTGRFKNVYARDGLELDLYKGSQVYVSNLTYLDDVDVYGGCLLMLDTVNMTSEADIYVAYGQPKLIVTNSQLGDYFCADGGEVTLIDVIMSDPDHDDGDFYVEYGAMAYIDNLTLSEWDYFEVYEGAKAWITNSNLIGHNDSYLYIIEGGEVFVENSVITFAYGQIYEGAFADFSECDITIDPYYLEIYEGSIADFYSCSIFANESIWVYDASIVTFTDCDITTISSSPHGIWLEDSSTGTFQNVDLYGTLWVSDLPNITVIDSTLVLNYTGSGLNATQWLHLYGSTVDVVDLEIYHLHNHLNASTINMLGNTTYREVRYGITAIVKDDDGKPIQNALVEIYDSLDNLIFSGYTDSDGKSEEIFPALGTYTIKAYADSKMDTATATLTNICIEETFSLDVTNPVIGTVTQAPTTPDYTENVNITVEVSDPSGILSVTLYYNNGTQYSVTMSHISGNSYKGTIPAQAYDTAVSYYIIAKDNSQNTATSGTYSYTVVDDIFPSVNITNIAAMSVANLYGTVTINFTASDDYLDTVYLYIDSEMFDVTGQTSFNWNTTTVADGSYTLKISATDEAGNTKETEYTVTVINLEHALDQISTLEGEKDDLEDEVDKWKGSVGTWQGLSAGTLVMGIIIGAAIIFFMKRQ